MLQADTSPGFKLPFTPHLETTGFAGAISFALTDNFLPHIEINVKIVGIRFRPIYSDLRSTVFDGLLNCWSSGRCMQRTYLNSTSLKAGYNFEQLISKDFPH
jgi:hypothetical protein